MLFVEFAIIAIIFGVAGFFAGANSPKTAAMIKADVSDLLEPIIRTHQVTYTPTAVTSA